VDAIIARRLGGFKEPSGRAARAVLAALSRSRRPQAACRVVSRTANRDG